MSDQNEPKWWIASKTIAILDLPQARVIVQLRDGLWRVRMTGDTTMPEQVLEGATNQEQAVLFVADAIDRYMGRISKPCMDRASDFVLKKPLPYESRRLSNRQTDPDGSDRVREGDFDR